ncbi:MAG: hypothetical protein F6J97_12865 [Leptolyngbya sp. SIO4C1]|nr:hypothetical protein [Leptolyngbya sp. SIO4C1]
MVTRIGRYLSLETFCTCTQTYRRYASQIDPLPKHPDSVLAIAALCTHILDPVIAQFGQARFQLTYGFCSADLKRFLAKKDPITGRKHGMASPHLDQHMAHEVNRNGRYYCDRLGAACDFRVVDLPSDALVDWIMEQNLPFDSLYFYGAARPIHISYGPQHKRAIWAFTPQGTPTRRGTERWRKGMEG